MTNFTALAHLASHEAGRPRLDVDFLWSQQMAMAAMGNFGGFQPRDFLGGDHSCRGHEFAKGTDLFLRSTWPVGIYWGYYGLLNL